LATDLTPIRDFVDGIASVFDYKVSDEIPKCFDGSDDQDNLYFLFKSLHEYSNTIVKGELNGFIVASLQSYRFVVSLKKSLDCVSKTKDWKKALEEMKMKDFEIGEFLRHVYYFTDAYPGKISYIMNDVFPLLEKKEYKLGGIVIGKNVEFLVKEKYDMRIMRVNAFINGIFLRNGIETPTKLREKCILEDKVKSMVHIVDLYHDWARELKDTNDKEAFSHTIKYLAKDGFKHYNETGTKTWDCIRESEDNERFVKRTKYNFDPFDMNFDFDLGVVLSDRKLSARYLKLLKGVRMLMKKRFRYYLLGGVTFGGIIHLVSENGSL
jgi:hypothetical protein